MATGLHEETIAIASRLVSLQLWDLGAIKVNIADPYQLVSGNYSPIYVNCRLLISSPAFMDLYAGAVRFTCEYRNVVFTVVAGGETAGIPFAAFLAQAFARPLIYVRKERKSHGLGSRIEGLLEPGATVLLAEDLITDAASKLAFIDAIQEAGAECRDVVVTFDRQQGGGKVLDERGIRLHALTDMATAISEARKVGLLSDIEFREIDTYLESPRDWHTHRSLVFKE